MVDYFFYGVQFFLYIRIIMMYWCNGLFLMKDVDFRNVWKENFDFGSVDFFDVIVIV